jgi:hypothetical protein
MFRENAMLRFSEKATNLRKESHTCFYIYFVTPKQAGDYFFQFLLPARNFLTLLA